MINSARIAHRRLLGRIHLIPPPTARMLNPRHPYEEPSSTPKTNHPTVLLTLIHRSAQKVNSAHFRFTEF
jgi:hypothetical protein